VLHTSTDAVEKGFADSNIALSSAVSAFFDSIGKGRFCQGPVRDAFERSKYLIEVNRQPLRERYPFVRS
jgi:hypothetical protein